MVIYSTIHEEIQKYIFHLITLCTCLSITDSDT